jgi:hypothetical protein
LITAAEVGQFTEYESLRSDVKAVDILASYIHADEFHICSCVDVLIEDMPEQKALIAVRSEICCIKTGVIKHSS